jgi:hypothetical protein
MLHWSSYLLFAFSLWAMVQSVRQPRWGWVYTILGVASCAAQLAFIEYFSGVELIRLIILWVLVSGSMPAATIARRLVKTFCLGLPYLSVLGAFMFYRIYLIPLPEPGYVRNQPEVLFALLHTPLSTGLGLAQNAIQDTIYVLFYSWFSIFEPSVVRISQPGIGLLSLLVGLLCYFYFNRLDYGEQPGSVEKPIWHRTALWIGLALVILGPIPGWVTERSIAENINMWRDRFVMASMLGASLVIVALIEWLARDVKRQNLVLAALVAGSVNFHINNSNQFRLAWEKQTNFYHQLAWRAPYIQPKTILFSDVEFLPFMGQFPVSFALASLYPKTNNALDLDYWFVSLSDEYNDQRAGLLNGMSIKYKKGFRRFKGESQDSLVFYFAPEKNQCLWVLTPEAKNLNILPQILQDIAPISNLSRIHTAAPFSDNFPAGIFGQESKHDWCYIFEKAALAQQQKDWAEILNLWQTAQKDGLQPKNGVEYLPFIEASAYSIMWNQAQELTTQALNLSPDIDQTLRLTWRQIINQTAPSFSRDEAYRQVQDIIKNNP